MLHTKDIKNLSELNSAFLDKHKRQEFFLSFIDVLKLGKLHSFFSSAKAKGISPLLLIHILIVFPLVDKKNPYSFTSDSFWADVCDYGKDAYYRLKNNTRINWRNFLFGVTKQMLKTLSEGDSSQESTTTPEVRAFIFDDTIIGKTSHKTEGVSRVWNHVIHKHILGYVLLLMGYYNGSVFVPLDFSFHREKGKKKTKLYGLKSKHYREQFRKKRDNNTAGYKRKKELDMSKIKAMVKMLKEAVKKGIDAQYVLTDSWFTCKETLFTAIANNLKYIGMYSKSKTKFTYRSKQYTYSQIRALNRKKVKRNRRFGLYYIRTVASLEGNPVVLYFTRKGKRGKWKTLISTDTSANFNNTLEVYQIRWSVEVFFKECKQSLGLGKCQSKNFDAQIADTTITLIQYQFLAIKKQINSYESLGAMIKDTKAECLEMKLHQRLIGLLLSTLEYLQEMLQDIDNDTVISRLLNSEKFFGQIMALLELERNQHKPVA